MRAALLICGAVALTSVSYAQIRAQSVGGAATQNGASPQNHRAFAQKCESAARAALGSDVKITRTTHSPASGAKSGTGLGGRGAMPALPAHCTVEGMINERIGAEGKPYGIGFAIALPDDWNGRFLLQGGGGLNGSVNPPIGPAAAGNRPALARGFAVISHDSGHKGAGFDESFLADQRAALDFAETSVKTVAVLGKEITQLYYGRPADHSYMTGCSTGGREGMLASQRYPELFDGIIVGAPAMRSGDSNLGVEFTQVQFNRAAPKGPDGKPIMSEVLTDRDRQTLLNGMLQQCDALDGLKDGIIENVAGCDFQPRKIQCTADGQSDCLSAGKVAALEAGMAGPREASGYPVYVPMAYDTGIVATPMGYLPTGGPGPFGPPSSATEMDVDARVHELRNTAWQRLTDTPFWTNLNTYLDRGGKMLFYHGVSDFWFSPFATWDYYQRASKDSGPRFAQSSRFYMNPGVLHCQGGNGYDSFDLLTPLVDWVEKDKAPDVVTAVKSSAPTEERPLCHFPSYPHYTGGDAKKASSYSCRAPQTNVFEQRLAASRTRS